jgi:hypothetical protein
MSAAARRSVSEYDVNVVFDRMARLLTRLAETRA